MSALIAFLEQIQAYLADPHGDKGHAQIQQKNKILKDNHMYDVDECVYS